MTATTRHKSISDATRVQQMSYQICEAARAMSRQTKPNPDCARKMAEILGQPVSGNTNDNAAIAIALAIARTDPLPANPHRENLTAQWNNSRFNPVFSLAESLLNCLIAPIANEVISILLRTAMEQLQKDPDRKMINALVQEFADNRKATAAYFTKAPAAAMMAHLSIPEDRQWRRDESLLNYHLADFACGSGALLTAAYQRLRELAREQGGSPDSCHARLVKNNLIGLDILPLHTALTAENLIGQVPEIECPETSIATLNAGIVKGKATLGAVDLLRPEYRQQKLIPLRKAERGKSATRKVKVNPESKDLVILNPPYNRIILEQLTMLPDPQEKDVAAIKDALQEVDHQGIASVNSGKASYFIPLAHRSIKPGGVLAAILPARTLTGSPNKQKNSWRNFTDLLLREYRKIIVVSIINSREHQSSFSRDTQVAEAMIIATKRQPAAKSSQPTDRQRIHFATLYRSPETPAEGYAFAKAIKKARARLKRTGTDYALTAITLADDQPEPESVGAMHSASISAGEPWPMIRVRDSHLIQIIKILKQGYIHDSRSLLARIPIAPLGEIARLGSSSGTVIKNFQVMVNGSRPVYQVLKHHDAGTQTRIEIPDPEPATAAPGREIHARRTWRKASRLHISEQFRYNSQATAAGMTPTPAVGGRGWPNLMMENPAYEKATALWLNGSLGLISHWAHSSHNQNGRSYANRQQLQEIPTLNVHALTKRQLEKMEELFDQYQTANLKPANQAWQDPVRIKLDQQILSDVLELDQRVLEQVATLRAHWCLEPTVQGRKANNPANHRELERLSQHIADLEEQGFTLNCEPYPDSDITEADLRRYNEKIEPVAPDKPTVPVPDIADSPIHEPESASRPDASGIGSSQAAEHHALTSISREPMSSQPTDNQDLRKLIDSTEPSSYGIIYLASPYWHSDESIRQARAQAVIRLAQRLIQQGQPVFCPIAYTHSLGDAGRIKPPEGWYQFDLNFLHQAAELVIARLPGWERSAGVLAEIAFAKALKLPIRHIEYTDIRRLLNSTLADTLNLSAGP